MRKMNIIQLRKHTATPVWSRTAGFGCWPREREAMST
jgi:hypothetical protein